MSGTNPIGYTAVGYAWCLTCVQDGVPVLNNGVSLAPISAWDQVDDDTFCDGCGVLIAAVNPDLRVPTEEVELGVPEGA